MQALVQMLRMRMPSPVASLVHQGARGSLVQVANPLHQMTVTVDPAVGRKPLQLKMRSRRLDVPSLLGTRHSAGARLLQPKVLADRRLAVIHLMLTPHPVKRTSMARELGVPRGTKGTSRAPAPVAATWMQKWKLMEEASRRGVRSQPHYHATSRHLQMGGQHSGCHHAKNSSQSPCLPQWGLL
jgi:hypothetical protein